MVSGVHNKLSYLGMVREANTSGEFEMHVKLQRILGAESMMKKDTGT